MEWLWLGAVFGTALFFTDSFGVALVVALVFAGLTFGEMETSYEEIQQEILSQEVITLPLGKTECDEECQQERDL